MGEDRGYRTLDELIELRAVTHATRPAVRDDRGELTYAALAARARAVARLLLERGLRPGERVAVQGCNCLTWVVAAYGVLLAGGTVVPIGHRVSSGERQRLLDGLRPRLVLIDDALPAPPAPDVVRFAELERLAPESGPLADRPRVDAAAAALVLSSSGTSGAVKSVAMGHWQLVRMYDDTRIVLDAVEDDVWLGVVPLAHSFGFNGVLLVSVMAGSCVRLAPEYDRARVAALVREERLTVLAGPPTIYHDLVEAGAAPPAARLAVVGSTEVSAPEMARLARELALPRVVSGYGMTETCGTVAMGDLPAEPEGPLPWMAPMPGVEVRILDEAGRELPVGERGRVVVRGYNLARPDTGAPDLEPGGWYDTGDVGQLDDAGRLAVAGRRHDTVIVSGFNVDPHEVETVLAEHPAVAAVAVIGVRDARRGQRLVGCVVPADGHAVDPAELVRFARARLTAYKVPGEVLVLPELPVTGTGKLSRARLRRLVEAGQVPSTC